jgi:XTP/dITP diphosphohydrolase
LKPTLFLATYNPGKIKELEGMLGDDFRLLSPRTNALERHAPLEVEENADSYFENALRKAIGYARTFRFPVLSDDSGLEVDALNGAPGVFSARYGGEKISWPERWAHLHRALAKVPESAWTARFRCVLCYYDLATVPSFFEGLAEGRIVIEPRGGKGFGYDPIFHCSNLQKTFAEASDDEKAGSSHRAAAIRSFLAWWKKRV